MERRAPSRAHHLVKLPLAARSLEERVYRAQHLLNPRWLGTLLNRVLELSRVKAQLHAAVLWRPQQRVPRSAWFASTLHLIVP